MRIRTLALAGVALTALSGCASGVAPAPQVSAPGLLGAGPPTATARPITTVDVCAALPARSVAKVSGWRLTSSEPETSTVGAAAASGCAYSGPDGALRLLVVPDGGDAALTALVGSDELGGGAIVVTGVGDAAQAALDGIAVRYGRDVVAVIERPAAGRLGLGVDERLAATLRDGLTG